LTSDYDSVPVVKFISANVLSPSVFAVACRLFVVNRDSTVRMRLMISTQPLPLDQGTHCTATAHRNYQ